MLLITAAHPDAPALDMALSEVLLRAVAAGTQPACARVFRPGPTVAFGRRDALLNGYPAAREAAIAHGYLPLLRLGGGHAAAYDEGSVIVELITAETGVGVGLEERFASAAALLQEALADLGLPAEVGELPGEYCPGRWSLHANGSTVKLAGLAQRSIRGAALTTAVLVVEHGAALRAVLVDVYAALGLIWDPATAGAAEDLRAGLRATDAATAVSAALGRRGPLTASRLDDQLVARARTLATLVR